MEHETKPEGTGVHPVLHVAKQIFRVEGETWILDSHNAQILEMAILDHAQDPALKDVIRTLFGLVVVLRDELKSPDAALYLTMVLGTVAPALQHLAAESKELAEELTSAELSAKAKAILGIESEAIEKISGPPPEGSISVRKLDMPPMPRPSKERGVAPKNVPPRPPPSARRG
jgi:hypothetical protein